jgi:pyruvate dehydrogenase E2 component (dihydrolipoamide acetyltransferase)
MAIEFKLPELGENITSGDLVKLLVKVGETVAKDQAVLELETEKASIEVPAPAAGRVKEIHVKEGQKVKVGQVVFTMEEAGEQAAAKETKAEKKAEAAPSPKPVEAPRPVEVKKPEPAPAVAREAVARREETPAPPPPQPADVIELVPAAPSVRRMARELGARIEDVQGTGPGGRITADDVKEHVKKLVTGGGVVTTAAPAA